jgi:hypothetical protein
VNTLDVFFHADRVGRLEQLPGAKLQFSYEPDWVRGEGAPLSIARRFHLSAGNAFAVLAEITQQPHNLKVPLRSVDGMVANEAYCMALAAAAGLSVAEALPISAGGKEGLLVRRYDRRPGDRAGRVDRIHQEDFCQAPGRDPEEKYQAHGGPWCRRLRRPSPRALRRTRPRPVRLLRRPGLQPADRQRRRPQQELLPATRGG